LFIVITIASFFILWAVVSIPVWISAKILKANQAKFARAMLVTAFGPIIYGIVFFVSTRILSSILPAGNSVNTIAIAIAFIAWIYVFKRGFRTGWIRALGISIAAIVVFVIIGIIIFFVASQFTSHTQLQPSPQTPLQPPVVPPMMPFQQV
jgi:hypothetical protein